MNTPRSTEELTKTIEQLVEGYVAEGRRAAREAIEHAFGAATRPAARTTKAGATPRRSGHPSGRRRSVQELEQLEERLCQLVRARPGESLTTFAAELQMTVQALQPRAEGRGWNHIGVVRSQRRCAASAHDLVSPPLGDVPTTSSQVHLLVPPRVDVRRRGEW
ncbi:MAG: hypothetical protein H6712_10460 [Myxococcales bacterium]|nr:hypothetical protein [Myxococcales bacterium]